MTSSIQALIEDSINTDSITSAPYSPDRADELRTLCDDCVENNTGSSAEYWGTDEDGRDWRVHLLRA